MTTDNRLPSLPPIPSEFSGEARRWLEAVAERLRAHDGELPRQATRDRKPTIGELTDAGVPNMARVLAPSSVNEALYGYRPLSGLTTITGTPTEIEVALPADTDVLLIGHDVMPTSDAQNLYLRTYEASAYVATGYDWAYAGGYGAATFGLAATAGTEIYVSYALGNASLEGASFLVEVRRGYEATMTTSVLTHVIGRNAVAAVASNTTVGRRTVKASATKFKVYWSGGSTFASGFTQVFTRRAVIAP